MTRRRKNLLVFSDDWGRHPSSCQYLMSYYLRQKLRTSGKICWVNTIGTRPPRFDRVTWQRGIEKLKSWIQVAGVRGERNRTYPCDGVHLPVDLEVLNPGMLPWLRGKVSRRFNATLLDKQLRPYLEHEPGEWIGLTTIPISGLVARQLPVDRWVYYCVDDFSVWPGLDGATLRDLESEVLETADQIICASEELANRIEALGYSSEVVTHGVDEAFWSAAGGQLPQQLADIVQSCPKPLVVFWGVVDRRLDCGWLSRLAESDHVGSMLLLGPLQNPDPSIFRESKIVTVGAVSIDCLPKIAAEAAALVMPYRDAAVTRAMQPLKLKEYMATGRPVVVRELPSTLAWRDCCDLCSTPEAFLRLTERRIFTGLPQQQELARGRLSQESWGAKAESFWPLVLGKAVELSTVGVA